MLFVVVDWRDETIQSFLPCAISSEEVQESFSMSGTIFRRNLLNTNWWLICSCKNGTYFTKAT